MPGTRQLCLADVTQLCRQQDRKRCLIELHPDPERLAAREIILRPAAVAALGRSQMGQDMSRIDQLMRRQQRKRRQRGIARPHQVIAAQRIAAVAPRHAQACHHRARIGAILMNLQHRCRLQPGVAKDVIGPRQSQARTPVIPVLQKLLAQRIERRRQRGARGREGTGGAAGEAERQHATGCRCFRGQCDGAILRAGDGIGEMAVSIQILPAVGRADVAAADLDEWRVGREARAEIPVARIGVAVLHPGAVVPAGTSQVWRDNHHQAIRPGNLETHQQHIALRIGQHLEAKFVVIAMMRNGQHRPVRAGRRQRVVAHALEIEPVRGAGRAVADQVEAEVAHLRLAGGRPVDLIDDAVPDCCPQARTAERRADVILIARAPGRRESRKPQTPRLPDIPSPPQWPHHRRHCRLPIRRHGWHHRPPDRRRCRRPSRVNRRD